MKPQTQENYIDSRTKAERKKDSRMKSITTSSSDLPKENWEKAKARIWNLIKSYYPQNNLDLALELEQELNNLLSQSQTQAEEKGYEKGLDEKFSDIDFKGTRNAIIKKAKKEREKILEEIEKLPTGNFDSTPFKEILIKKIKS